VVVDFLVVVLIEMLLTVTELLGCTVVVLVVLGSIEMVVLMVVEAAFWVLELVIKTVDPWLIVTDVGLGEDVYRTVTVVVPLTVEVVAPLVVTPASVTVPLTTLVLVTGSGVIVRPTSSVTTDVEVEVTSGDTMEVVAVTFNVLVFSTSIALIERVSVLFTTVVEVTSGAVTTALAVSFAITVVVVYAVTIGKLLEDVRLIVDSDAVEDAVEEETRDEDAVLQTCGEPIPTVKGWVSTYRKSMKAVDGKNDAS